MTLTNASDRLNSAKPTEGTPLAGLGRDELEPTQAVGSPVIDRVCFPQVSSLPRTPSKDLTQAQRRSPPHSHTDATTTK